MINSTKQELRDRHSIHQDLKVVIPILENATSNASSISAVPITDSPTVTSTMTLSKEENTLLPSSTTNNNNHAGSSSGVSTTTLANLSKFDENNSTSLVPHTNTTSASMGGSTYGLNTNIITLILWLIVLALILLCLLLVFSLLSLLLLMGYIVRKL